MIQNALLFALLVPGAFQAPDAADYSEHLRALESMRPEMERTVVLKVVDNRPAWIEGGLVRGSSPDMAVLSETLAGYQVERYFQQSPAELDAFRNRALARGATRAPDLNQYFRVRTSGRADSDALAARLQGLPVVAHAYRRPMPAPPPAAQDIPPVTPDFTASQEHFGPAATGSGFFANMAILGAQGRNVRMTDCEFAWYFTHEDLGLTNSALVGGIPIVIFPDHGTAVLGQIYGQENDYGVTGSNPRCEVKLASEYTFEFGLDPTQSIINAALASSPGDVVMIQQQTEGPNLEFLPEEWTQASFDVIQLATAGGIHVVEAAGNGGIDLDDPLYGGVFDLQVRDSGAIMVGAGASGAVHSKLSFSNYGSRLDCQGWGEFIPTAGYGDLFAVGQDVRQFYTGQFSGTSSGSGMVCGAAVAAVGVMKAHGMALPTPAALRAALRNTGTPQPAADEAANGRIGPLPDVGELLGYLGTPGGLIHTSRAPVGGSIQLNMKTLRPFANWYLYRALDTAIRPTPDGVRVLGDRKFKLAFSGIVNAQGERTASGPIPNKPGLIGRTVYLQVLFTSDAGNIFSNGTQVKLY